jgi:hypothetical protein
VIAEIVADTKDRLQKEANLKQIVSAGWVASPTGGTFAESFALECFLKYKKRIEECTPYICNDLLTG